MTEFLGSLVQFVHQLYQEGTLTAQLLICAGAIVQNEPGILHFCSGILALPHWGRPLLFDRRPIACGAPDELVVHCLLAT